MSFNTNTLIPKYIPNNLKWNERDGLNTWYLEGKCNDFLEDVDNYLSNVKIVNCDMILNEPSKEMIRNYKSVKFENIEKYPEVNQIEIKESICRNVKKDNFHVNKETSSKLLQQNNSTNIKKLVAIGRGRFLKKCKDSMYASYW